jgi:hypothetical protein
MANDLTTQTSALATIPDATKVSTFQLGSSNAHAQVVSEGGNATVAVAAGASSNTVVKGSAGLLARVLVTAAGTADMSIYDNAATNSGTVVGIVPGNSPTGSVYEFHMPCANGITVAGNAANPGVTIAYA